jgi:RNA polymerase sigma-70 factor (ECF subfamily)
MDNGDRVWQERGLQSAIMAGDERAWRTLYDRAFAGLYAYVSWRCAGVREFTEEVVQETWSIAVRRIGRFEAGKGSFQCWLQGIAANVLRNQLRRRARHRRHLRPLTNEPLDHETASEADRAERIARALAELPERYEAVLRAKYLDEQSVAMIAEVWKETPKAVESLLTRARQAFRDAYEHME